MTGGELDRGRVHGIAAANEVATAKAARGRGRAIVTEIATGIATGGGAAAVAPRGRAAALAPPDATGTGVYVLGRRIARSARRSVWNVRKSVIANVKGCLLSKRNSSAVNSCSELC